MVVEIAGSTSGAHTAKLFGDLGAQVVCLEPPEGAPLRKDPAKWAAWATSRQSVALSSAMAQLWLDCADVVIESSDDGPLTDRPIPGANHRAVRVQITPFGSSGPYCSWTGADIVDQAISGHLYLSGLPHREPLQGPTGQAALAAAVHAAIGAMAALHARERSGPEAPGQLVEVTHHEALVAMHQFTDVRFTHNGNVLTRMGNRYAGPGSPIGMYRAADGWVALTVSTAAHAEVLLAVTGLGSLLDRPEVGSITDLMVNAELFDPALEGWLAEHSVDEVVELLQSVRVAAGPVLTMRELLEDAQLAARNWWVSTSICETDVRLPGPPFRIESLPWRAAPAPGPIGTAADPVREVNVGVPRSRDHHGHDHERTGPLQGLRVLDLTRVWAGPLAARILGELGADVVMLEAPWARGPREMPASFVAACHFYPDDEPLPAAWNRSGFVNKFAITKRSIGLDITTADGRAAFERLVAGADVLIENYSPRVMPNLGFTQDRLHELNPALIYVTMPGYGRSGPARDYSAYGPVLDSHAGLSTLMGYRDVDAWKCGIAWPDPVAGIHAAFAVLAALWERGDGAGTTIEVAQFETAVTMIADRLVRAQLDNADPPILGNRDPVHAPQGVYACAGVDRWLAISVSTDAAWSSLCKVANLPHQWRSWGRAVRSARHDEVDAAIAGWSGTLSPAEAASLLQAAGVAAAPVVDAAMLHDDQHLVARGVYVEVAHPEAGTHRWGPTCAARLLDTPAALRRRAPCLGEHNREVLREWAAMDDEAIDALLTSGTLADRPPD